MALFDRPFKKITDEAPPQFSALSMIALSRTDDRIRELGVDLPTHKQDMKTAVVAALAIKANEMLGTWSATALREATRRGDFSISQLPPHLVPEVADIISFTWTTFRFLLAPEKPSD